METALSRRLLCFLFKLWVKYSTFKCWHQYGCMFCFGSFVFWMAFLFTCMLHWSCFGIIVGKKAYDDKACTRHISAWKFPNKHAKCNLCFDSSKGIHQQCACKNSPILVSKRINARGEKWFLIFHTIDSLV